MSEVTLLEIKQDLAQSFEELKSGQADMVSKEEMKRIDDAMDAKEDRINKLEAELKKATMPSQKELKEGADSFESKKLLNKFLRKGKEALSTEELKMLIKGNTNLLSKADTTLALESKAMYSNDDEDGGYLTGTDFVKDMIKNIVEFSPVRQFASVRTTNMPVVEIPKRTSTFTAVWTSQQATRSETEGWKFGMERIPADECTAEVYIGFSNLEDSMFNLEALLSQEFGEQFGVLEGTAFLTGNGVGQPFGIMNATGLNEVVSGDASLITWDGMINAYHELKAPYATRGTWMFERATLRDIRKLVDGEGQYMWSPGLPNGAPSTILGAGYATAEDMATIGAGTYPVLFGDFKAGYQIIDRIALDITRDPYSQASAGAVKFVARKRVGGQVVKPEAFVKLEIAAS